MIGGEKVIRGIQRQTVVMRTQESPCFEEVHFFLRSSYATDIGENDILREADRILAESGLFPERRRRKGRRGRAILCFLVGLLTGTGGTLLVWLLTALL